MSDSLDTTPIRPPAGPCPATTLRLAVVVLNYRTPKLVADCLATLEGQIDPIQDLAVVVDNHSGDGSDDQIEQEIAQRGWGDWVRLVRSPVNGGFAAGNNVGIEAVRAQRYLLLNSDTLMRDGAIASMMAALDHHADVGMLGPRLEWPDGTPQESSFRFRTPITELINAARTGPLTRLFPGHETAMPAVDTPCRPDWVSFACVLIRREVIDKIGGLDEGYFMYYDDIDHCRRARQAGWEILYWPQAHVVHLRGGSGPVKELTKALKRRPAYLYASRTRYYAKYYGIVGVWWANLLWTAGRAISLARELIGKKPRHTCDKEWRDIWINALRPMSQANTRPEAKR